MGPLPLMSSTPRDVMRSGGHCRRSCSAASSERLIFSAWELLSMRDAVFTCSHWKGGKHGTKCQIISNKGNEKQSSSVHSR